MADSPDTVSLVARRATILAALQDGSRSKRDVAADLDVSRSTVDRAMRELEFAGFVRRVGNGVELTLPGSLALKSYRNHAAELGGIEAAHELLDDYPGALDIPPEVFRDAIVVTPDRHAPHRPATVLLDLLCGSARVKHYATGIRPEYLDTYWDVVFDGGTLDVVATADVIDEALQTHAGTVDDAFATGNFTLTEAAECRPYSFIVADGTGVCMLFYQDHAVIGLVRNDTAAALEWASKEFETLRAGATPVADR